MSALTLVIGNKNYSSWSLRGWLVASHSGLAFDERQLALQAPEFKQQIAHFSPAGRVPVLLVGEVAIWDSLAIAEYLAEQAPRLWPAAVLDRAKARAISAEMHSGFPALRQQMPMNVRATGRHVASTAALEADIARIIGIWEACRQEYAAQGPWLFGHWSIADAMYAPVASRFHTYGVQLPELSRAYLSTVLADPWFLGWKALAQHEAFLDRSEVGEV
jgi:glutathione S-transferase